MIGKEGEGKRHWDGKRERETNRESERERESQIEREWEREWQRETPHPLHVPVWSLLLSLHVYLSLTLLLSLHLSLSLSFPHSLSVCVSLSPYLLSHLQNDVLPWNWNRMTILRVRFSLVKSKNSVQKDLLSSSILKENKILPIHQTLTWRFWKFGSDPSVPFSCCGDLQIYWKIIEQFFIRQMNYSANIY